MHLKLHDMFDMADIWYKIQCVNTLRPRPNGCHFAEDRFKCICLNENKWISVSISLKFVPKGQINNIPALVQIMAWCRPGDKPLSESMMFSLLTHICVTRPQWVNVMACYLFIHRCWYISDLLHDPCNGWGNMWALMENTWGRGGLLAKGYRWDVVWINCTL